MNKKNYILIALSICSALSLSACDNMRDGSKLKPYEKSEFFEDGSATRPLVKGTVPRGHLEEDSHLYRGMVGEELATTFPMAITSDILDRGEERYNIYCAVCHDKTGSGNGYIIQRGHKQPPSFHEQRLLESPHGYYFNVISDGFGAMYGYRNEIKPADRWAVIAYIRTLQYAQNRPGEALSEMDKKKLTMGSDAHHDEQHGGGHH